MIAVLKILSLVCVIVCFAALTYFGILSGIEIVGKYAGAYLSAPVVRFLVSLLALPVPQILYKIGAAIQESIQYRIDRNPVYQIPGELRHLQATVDSIQEDVKSILGDSNDTTTSQTSSTTMPGDGSVTSP